MDVLLNHDHKNLEYARAYSGPFILKSSDEKYRCSFGICKIKNGHVEEMIKRHFHKSEQDKFNEIKYERRMNSYVVGRYAGKLAVSDFSAENDIRTIAIHNGIFNQPYIISDSIRNVQISISHCNDLGVAIAFTDGLLMGIDIEKIDPSKFRFLKSSLTPKEMDILKKFNCGEDILFMFWTIKESLSKVLKTGLTLPLELLEVKEFTQHSAVYHSCFENFPQFRSVSIVLMGYICSITFPKKLSLNISDIQMHQKIIESILKKL
ncbi:4'-phosphopantetheinyl transferase superfamily protein [Paenibacillus sp. GbtcB18]|uniref:4'-phosphopantetheinyl transferase family protein n=1 Tax=Paenibacillus sp. GbtcB18 TaxID=2824763 RepID=UPI001C2FFA3B|nr:4'-phosphopantetheinyl transferase superfamily protein [Paenibacillus sp. GbtcB18]